MMFMLKAAGENNKANFVIWPQLKGSRRQKLFRNLWTQLLMHELGILLP